MKKLTPSIIFIFLLIFVAASAFANDEKAVVFRQEDRDRLIKLEVRVDEGFKNVNQRIDSLEVRMQRQNDDLKAQMQKQNDDLKNFMFWGFGILFTMFSGGIVIMVGFVLWDRRTVVAPVAKNQKELQEMVEELVKKEKRLEEAFSVCVKRDSEAAEFAKSLGIQLH
ncbi:conserved exported hypothetical protein [Candidatus Magnetomoraceae bacterium gMMP-1]